MEIERKYEILLVSGGKVYFDQVVPGKGGELYASNKGEKYEGHYSAWYSQKDLTVFSSSAWLAYRQVERDPSWRPS